MKTNGQMLNTAEMVSYEWHHALIFVYTHKLSEALHKLTDSTSAGDLPHANNWPVIEVVERHSQAFQFISSPFVLMNYNALLSYRGLDISMTGPL